MPKFSPFKFLQEVRAEADKVTWPTRRETLITTAMVFVMVTFAAVFFLIADQIMRFLVTIILDVSALPGKFNELNPVVVFVIGVVLAVLAVFAWSLDKKRRRRN
jgi:preprotein translocase subunit SecE